MNSLWITEDAFNFGSDTDHIRRCVICIRILPRLLTTADFDEIWCREAVEAQGQRSRLSTTKTRINWAVGWRTLSEVMRSTECPSSFWDTVKFWPVVFGVMSRLCVINKIHWCVAVRCLSPAINKINAAASCYNLYLTVEMLTTSEGHREFPFWKLKISSSLVQKFPKIPVTKISHLCTFTSIKPIDNCTSIRQLVIKRL